MRKLLRLALVAGVAGASLLLSPAPAALAHPLGNFTVNLYSGITVRPGEVQVAYVLDMAEIPTFQEMDRIDTDGDGTVTDAERQAWAGARARELLSRLSFRADGRLVPLEIASRSMRLRPGQAGLKTLRLEATFTGPIPASGRIEYEDGNYADRLGWREITAVAEAGRRLLESSVPAASLSRGLLSYPSDLLSRPVHVTKARLSFAPGRSVEVTGGEQESLAPNGGRPRVDPGGFAGLVAGSSLSLPAVVLSLVLALCFGALHALGPGHGKTIMAGWLVGTTGRARQAVAAAVAVSAMHTASVLVLGLLVLSAQELFPPERVYPWLGLLSGVIALALGVGLVVRRRRESHAERPGEHDHGGVPHVHHAQGHALAPHGILSRRGLAALAVSGGILPSPSALLVLLAAVALHRVLFGLALVLAFSLGLAAALTAVGLLASKAGDLLAGRVHGSLARLVPLAGPAVIVVAGTVLVARALVQL